MSIFRMKSLAAKLILVTGVAIAVVLFVSNLFLISQTRNRVETLTMDQANAEAKAIATDVGAAVGELAGAARSMAGVIGRGQDGKYVDRKAVVDMLKANVEQNAFAFGSWFAEEPNAFDGQSPSMAGKPEFGSSKDGTFNPYWTKSKDGGFTFSTFDSDYVAPWYSLAAKSLKGAISPPYAESTTGENTAMTSIAYPVTVNGKLIGVSGVDISLKAMADKLNKLQPFGSGRVTLLSQTGKWIVAPTPDLQMKDYDGTGADLVKSAITSLTGGVIKGLDDGQGSFDRVVYPFALPDVNTNWVVLVDVPHAAINAPLEAQTYMMVIGGLIVLGAVMFALYCAVRSFVQTPLGGLVASVKTLSAGQYSEPVTGQDSKDEIGLVAQALEGFRHRLAESHTLAAQAEAQRNDAEGERRRSEQERNQSASVQQHVVSALGNGLAQLSQGNLTYRIGDDFPGDYEALKRDFNNALASLEQAIASVNVSVVNIGAGSSEISESAADLSKRTEQQAASLEETAAALNELTEQVHSSADNAGIAANTVSVAVQDAEKSGEVVQRAVTSMQGIAQSSQEISRIIGVIDEIAFQTNLLALNAGVEAARAGEAGKGFAVVAQEVRELAQRSANAAKEIKTLINASGAQVRDGVQLVGQAGETLQKISDQVMQINGLILQISASASEQASGLKEVNSAVNQMDQVTQQNAAMVEETTAASMTLRSEAENLKGLVSRFTVSGHRNPVHALQAAAQTLRAPARPQTTHARAPAPSYQPAPKKVAAGGGSRGGDDWEEF
ncbi:methyl-accepting chemotaxis sensory transducer with Cache sensor [Rhizobium sp. PDO1-076]|uniref:methyl-accepting chemotaxis protein n=1 Tax=Rhizobium sp. PDO1-076 TaxID=1125979 RepID=UPI00024E3B1A|nr:methyl-accepting chemotaxis protein [Rhizobium sp. PDO1-076]EHS51468.1 methyl-accepting chemotaxis sensory transducer with Cache sensor [Rhizobium sp. PDO1-076]